MSELEVTRELAVQYLVDEIQWNETAIRREKVLGDAGFGTGCSAEHEKNLAILRFVLGEIRMAVAT